jgi:hypothetical protein
MALLNPPDILPEAMRFLTRALLAHRQATCSEEELLSLVAPQGLVEAMKSIGSDADTDEPVDDLLTGGMVIAKASLDALSRLKLLNLEGRSVTAGDDMLTEWSTARDVTPRSFARVIRRAVWRQASGPEPQRVFDLVQAVALLAAAPEPLKPFDSFDSSNATRPFQKFQASHLGTKQEDWAVGNSPRWLAFRRFAPYIGVALLTSTRTAKSSAGLTADSSAALAEDLELTAGLYDVATFVDSCASALPFLDGGPYSIDDHRPAQELSGGLSLSLRQLQAKGLLELLVESDIATRTVALGAEPGSRENISHVRWIGNSKTRKTAA